MIPTFQALVVALLMVLPGASYTFAFERVAGSYGISFADRLIRFLASSALFHALFAAPEYLLFRHAVVGNRLATGKINPWLVEASVLTYVIVPVLVGTLLGWGHKHHKNWAIRLVGEAPEPRAWDYLWRHAERAVVRIKLKSGGWLAGYYGTTSEGRRSYAAGFPEDGDLYLALAFDIDSATGALSLTPEGTPTPVSSDRGLLIRWNEIEYLDIQEY
ncbi:DUF6338 family protein [Nocardia africana]|uniref:Uncharacterized protein n=1 Tax=Nocardia africana TaxID=134964 RepID=A0A378X095_9NOCA|nr:DUF6338 family protein [Nocardia africana]MCC3312259.1 DUF6338 family protein [Nocardia africana]SUA46437.1 Uncharacterised protein [Nocardia africana]